jgi:neutral ceramidase
MRSRGSKLACLLACAALALACGDTIKFNVPARVDAGPSNSPVPLLAGAATRDLTPIPGIPLGGYSMAGKVSRGFWTRLYARAIYLEDERGHSLVLVNTELMIMPAGLVDRVVELLHEPTTKMPLASMGVPLTRIGRDNLLIAATETHQSPGNFFTSRLYNSFSSPQEGFDPELFEFIARRITQAIKEAFHTREKATLLTSHVVGAQVDKDVLDKFVRNRSLDAFLLNPEADDVLTANATRLSACPVGDPDWPVEDYPDPRACQAVRARVDMLQVKRESDLSTIALALFVPAHITVLDAQSEVYASDVFGLAAQLVEHAMRKGPACGFVNPSTTPPPRPSVVSVFNGAQGDVSLWWKGRTREDAIELAERLAEHVCKRIGEGLRVPTAPPHIDFQFDYVDVDGQLFDDAGKYTRSTAETAATGAPEFGGAEEQRTVFHDVGQKEGVRHYARREHGSKHPPLYGELLGMKFDPVGFALSYYRPPDVAPIGVYRISDMVVVGFPSEPTTVVGRRIRTQISGALALASADQVLIASFANGHVSYVTTPQEYDRQTYEGASNFWGAATGPLLQLETLGLANALSTVPPPPRAFATSYPVGSERVFEPRNAWGPAYDPDEGLANIVVRDGDPYRGHPTFCWRDVIPSLGVGAPECVNTVPGVSIVDAGTGGIVEIDGVPQTNRGFTMVTTMVAISREETEWCAIWLRPATPPPLPISSTSCQFAVARISGLPENSDAFGCSDQAPPQTRPVDSLNQLMSPLESNDGSFWLCKWPFDSLGLCSEKCYAGDI